ncbi:hypothetical protein X975_05673, partial [Stegodyphus mimosarum]
MREFKCKISTCRNFSCTFVCARVFDILYSLQNIQKLDMKCSSVCLILALFVVNLETAKPRPNNYPNSLGNIYENAR